MEEKAEGEEANGGLQVSQYKNSPQCCPLEELETIKSTRMGNTVVTREGTHSTGARGLTWFLDDHRVPIPWIFKTGLLCVDLAALECSL